MKEFNLSKEKKLAIEKAKNFKENFNCSDCSDCSNCYDCYDCSNCSDCSNCYDCSDKTYMICNVQFTKEEYEAWKKNLI